MFLEYQDMRWNERRAELHDYEKLTKELGRVYKESFRYGTLSLDERREALRRARHAWRGLENLDGTGVAVISFPNSLSPYSPASPENVRDYPTLQQPTPQYQSYEFSLLVALWTEAFPWRKIDHWRFQKMWVAHQQPYHAGLAFKQRLIVLFNRRTGFEDDTPQGLYRRSGGCDPWELATNI